MLPEVYGTSALSVGLLLHIGHLEVVHYMMRSVEQSCLIVLKFVSFIALAGIFLATKLVIICQKYGDVSQLILSN